MKYKIALLIGMSVLTAVTSCQEGSDINNSGADRILIGSVITMDKDSTVAQAVAFKDGKILFVGSAKDAEKYRGKGTKVHNYGKASIYPGFMDGHTHGFFAAGRYTEADLSAIDDADGTKMSDFVAAMKKYMDANPGKSIYKGSGWSIKEGVLPTAAMLDAICPDVPMLLNSKDGHSMWINTAAMTHFKIDKTWVSKYGENCVRTDADGNITGYLSEAPVFVLMNATSMSREECAEWLLKWQEYAFSRGITATTEAAASLSGGVGTAYLNMAASPLWKLRTYAVEEIGESVPNEKLDSALSRILQFHREYDSEYFKVTGIKIFVDGIVEARTAWLKDAYDDNDDNPSYTGLKRCSDPERVAKIVEFANRNGMNVHFHCIGDSATALAVEGIIRGQNAAGVEFGRNTIAHLQLVDPEDIKKIAKNNIIAVLAPQWALQDQDEYKLTQKYIGHRAETMFPVKSFLEAGALINLHSDYPVSVPLSIQQNFCAAIYRTCEYRGEVLKRNTDEEIDRYHALQAVTINVACQWGQENNLGSLEIGKVANAVVCDANFLKDDVKTILNSKILETIVDGETVYSQN